jgi:hypothetical protein
MAVAPRPTVEVTSVIESRRTYGQSHQECEGPLRADSSEPNRADRAALGP